MTYELRREVVEARLRELNAQRDQKIADANALTGAIQDCQFWLAEVEKAEALSSQPQKDD